MLISGIKEIDNLRMTCVTSRPVKAEKVLVIDHMVVALLGGGRWWCSWKDFHKFAFMPGSYQGRCRSLLVGLQRLGIVSQAAVDAHLSHCERVDSERSAKYDREELGRLAKKYGFKPPAIAARRE